VLNRQPCCGEAFVPSEHASLQRPHACREDLDLLARVAGGAHWSPASLPDGMAPGVRETVFWTPQQLQAPDENDVINSSGAYGFVFDICAVEVDKATGKVRPGPTARSAAPSRRGSAPR
jgi:CO/xanthine dehydrogenase Mo-binding subunit